VKITEIEIFNCNINKRDPTMAAFNPVLIRVNTDEGVSGVGEAGLAYGAGSNAAVGMIKDLAKYVIGRDPMKIEAIWEHLFRSSVWGMGGGPITYAGFSAIDIACWDIRGKALGVPVYQLLGGRSRDSQRTYASQIQFDWDSRFKPLRRPEEYAEAALKALADGYDCVKVDPIMIAPAGDVPPGHSPNQRFYGLLLKADLDSARNRIAAIREAVGDAMDIIVEIHAFLGVNSAIQLGRALEEFNIFFYEEPVHPLNPSNMALVARNVRIPVATGERSYTRWGYREMLEKQALAVVQPDLCLCGGITEGKKICDHANIYDATVQIHVCGGPVSKAAALQIEAVIPNFVIHEHHTYALKECNIELCTNNYQPVKGRYTTPDLPGIGQELNDDVVGDYRVEVLKN
jgi:L-alanine-DL-glutamate epimerase-like enolase superfamily enzyme